MKEQTYIKPIAVTAARIENGKVVLYAGDAVKTKITGEYFTSHEEAKDKFEKGPRYYAK